MNRAIAIQRMRPNAVLNRDFYVIDDGANGERIDWRMDGFAVPTEAELVTAYADWEAEQMNKAPAAPSLEERIRYLEDLELQRIIGG